MEALSRVFKREVPEGSFEGFVVGTNCGNTVSVSHPLFAEDSILFSSSSKDLI